MDPSASAEHPRHPGHRDAEPWQVEQGEYDRALELWPTRLLGATKNLELIPTWSEGGERFWFRETTDEGHRFVSVEAESGQRSPAFDHERVARVLGLDPQRLPVRGFTFEPGWLVLDLYGREQLVAVDLGADAVAEVPREDPYLLPGPDGSALFLRDFDLWIRRPDGGCEALTHDGREYYRWSDLHDGHKRGRIDENWAPVRRKPQGTFWSDDGSLILTSRADDRHVVPYEYLEAVPRDGSVRPRVHQIRKRISGEAGRSLVEWWIIAPATGIRTPVQTLPGELEIRREDAWWHPDGTRVFAVASTSALDHVAIVEIDAATGATRLLHEARTDTWWDFTTHSFDAPLVRFLADRNEFLWFSEQSGWGHVYAIDADSGEVVRQITEGDWSVWDVLHVDGERMIFVAGGMDPHQHPYHRNWYRVDLDGDAPNAGLVRLTPEPLDHAQRPRARARVNRAPATTSEVSPCGRYLIDSMSSIDTPPVHVLRSTTDGRIIAEVARCDASGLDELGWQPPEAFTAKTAHGDFDMWGIVIRPRRFASRDSWPVIERVYGGNQTFVQPRSFGEALNGHFLYAAYCLAEMGFVVVMVDGPGTPFRSRAFRDLNVGSQDRMGLEHHRAAIEQLAQARPWMDLSRLAICGHSFGGFSTTMALLLHPDFYRVGHASCPGYDVPFMHAEVMDWHFGWPDYGGGRRYKTSPDEIAQNHLVASPSGHIRALEGELEIVYADLDENTDPSAVLNVVNSLVDAGKSYNMVYLPGRNHHNTTEPYHQKRLWDWMLERVAHRRPLYHYVLPVAEGVRGQLSEWSAASSGSEAGT